MKKINIRVSKNQLRKIILIIWPFILALLVFISVRYAVHNSRFVDLYYSTGIYPFIAKLISGLSNLVPFSIWDLFWVMTIVLLIAGLILAIFRKVKWKTYGLSVLQSAALLYVFFYVVWGFNYFRPKIETRVSWKNKNLTMRFSDQFSIQSFLIPIQAMFRFLLPIIQQLTVWLRSRTGRTARNWESIIRMVHDYQRR